MDEQQRQPEDQEGTGGIVWRVKRTLWVGGEPMSRKDKVLATILVLVFFFVAYVVIDANKYAATVRVIPGEGRVGVNPTTERLDFGDLSRGTSASRTVILENNTFMPMYVAVMKTGDIGELIDVSDAGFLLPSGGNQEVDFSLYMPASAVEEHRYHGRVFVFKIPTFWLTGTGK